MGYKLQLKQFRQHQDDGKVVENVFLQRNRRDKQALLYFRESQQVIRYLQYPLHPKAVHTALMCSQWSRASAAPGESVPNCWISPQPTLMIISWWRNSRDWLGSESQRVDLGLKLRDLDYILQTATVTEKGACGKCETKEEKKRATERNTVREGVWCWRDMRVCV